VSFCEHGDEALGSITGNFFQRLNENQLPEEDSVPCS